MFPAETMRLEMPLKHPEGLRKKVLLTDREEIHGRREPSQGCRSMV